MFEVAGDAYDDFMGRYSRRLAPLFADFAGVVAGARVLDIGAGTGALAGELLRRGAEVVAVEPSESFAGVLRERFPGLEVHETAAEELPIPDDAFDVALAQLVVAFLADAQVAIAELARVARRVAICMWGVAEVEMFAALDATAEAIGATRAREPRRFRTPQELHDLVAPHGSVESTELDVTATYADFAEFWDALNRRVGPAGYWLESLDAETLGRAHDELFVQLGSPPDGFELRARAFAVAVTRA